MNQSKIIVWLAIVASTLLASGWGAAQDIRLRPGDTVRLEVPQREDLTRLLDLDARGMVNLPIVGQIALGGLTIEEARGLLLRSLQELYPSVRSVGLSLIGGEARTFIYVQGQVARPDKYDLSLASNLWDAIREAGGTTAAASLDAVRLIRVERDSTTTTVVDVQRALDAGDLSSLPPLRPGDTVIVPERGVAAQAASGSVLVVGAVAAPAPYRLGEGKRVVDAILAAGGWTENASLGKVTIIRPLARGGSRTTKVDVGKYLKTGDARHNPVVLAGDTVSVPRKSSLIAFFLNPAFIIGLITTSATLITIIITTQE